MKVFCVSERMKLYMYCLHNSPYVVCASLRRNVSISTYSEFFETMTEYSSYDDIDVYKNNC